MRGGRRVERRLERGDERQRAWPRPACAAPFGAASCRCAACAPSSRRRRRARRPSRRRTTRATARPTVRSVVVAADAVGLDRLVQRRRCGRGRGRRPRRHRVRGLRCGGTNGLRCRCGRARGLLRTSLEANPARARGAERQRRQAQDEPAKGNALHSSETFGRNEKGRPQIAAALFPVPNSYCPVRDPYPDLPLLLCGRRRVRP